MAKWHDELGNFESHFEKQNGCWLWQACKDKDGYGVSRYNHRKVAAHRVAWLFYKGRIPKGLYILHTCHNSSCVNPDHLYLGTQQDNINDQIRLGTNVGKNRVTSILTENLVRYIRSSGKKAKELSVELGVSNHCIWDCLRRKTWNHVN